MKRYLYDKQWILIGELVLKSQSEPFPVNSTKIKPPALTAGEVAKFNGDRWEILTERPVLPSNVPYIITMRQVRIALARSGLISSIETALSAIPEPHQTEARIEWEYGHEIRRDHPLLIEIQSSLGITDEEVDNLFILAGAV